MLTARIIEDADGQILILPKEIHIEQSVLLVQKIGSCLLLSPLAHDTEIRKQGEFAEPFCISEHTLAMMDASVEHAKCGEISAPVNINGTAEVSKSIRRDE